jgi:hypothetical protein
MRLPAFLICALLSASAPVRAQQSPPSPSPPASSPVESPPVPSPDETLRDWNAVRRRALFDTGFDALLEGDLPLAQRAFEEAAALDGDPAQSAVAESFAERVRATIERRRLRPPQRRFQDPPVVRDAGRTERIALLGTTTALGLGLYGWTLPQVLGVDANSSTRAFVGLYMVTAASSFLVPFLVLRDQTPSEGQANLAFYGATRGIWGGVLLGALFAGEISPDHRARGWKAGMLFGSIGGLVAGYQIARAADFTAGEARTVAAMGDYGLLFGFGVGYLAQFNTAGSRPCLNFEPQVQDCTGGVATDAQFRKMSAAGLVGAGLGLTGGYYLARARQNSWGDGEVMRASSLVGIWLAAGVSGLTDHDRDFLAFDQRAYTAALMGGGTMGLLIGDRLVRNTDFTVGQSLLVDLATMAGGLMGGGISYLAAPHAGSGPFALATALGGATGFALSYAGLRDRAESRTTRALSRLGGSGIALVPTVGPLGDRGLALAGQF